MRVLFINRMISMVRGGGETFDLEMARHLESPECQTAFLSGIPLFSQPDSPLDHPRSSTVRSPYTGWFPWDRVWQAWRLRVWDFRCFERKVARWAKTHRDEYDIIQICEMPPLIDDLLKQKLDCPIVMRITAPDYHDPHKAVTRASAIIASGTSIATLRQGVRPDAVDIPNGVDTDRFQAGPSDFRAAEGIPDTDFVILFVARFHEVKNHAMLIRAFKQVLETVPHARLVMVGAGPLEQLMRKRCREQGTESRVHFLGEVVYEDLPKIYAAVDLKVISSNYESFCFAALEGMASSLPLVVTATDWVPGLIAQDQGGIVVPKDDATAMAQSICTLQQDPERRKQMGTWNRTRVLADFRWETSAQKLLTLYESLLS
ncbi:MAG: glycosyltransferase involved in cell wall biosynthesis [Candidatus Omnitrophota bacterium]|jgi:glycosyltransferase involved in cell wall biosynthesis